MLKLGMLKAAVLLAVLTQPVWAGAAEDQVLAAVNKARAGAGCSALTVNAKLENPKGRRVETIFDAQGKISAEQIYPVAFVTAQGVPAHIDRNRRDLPIMAIDALRTWFADPSHDAQPGRGVLRIT